MLLTKEVDKCIAGLPSVIIRHCRKVLLDAMQQTDTFVSIMFIAMLMMPITSSLDVIV